MHRNRYENADTTLGGRLAAALVTLLFSLPVVGLLWFLLNTQLGLFTTGYLSAKYLVIGILAFAAWGFVFPRFVGDLVGKLYKLLQWVARLW